MIVVSDTSPIINLAAVEHLTLLHRLYGHVLIPQRVYDEIVAGNEQPGAQEIRNYSWIESRSVKDDAVVLALHDALDPGEAEAIALALQEKADLLLLDERRGRAFAAQYGLRFIGILGILIEAKRRHEIPTVKPVMDALIAKAGFWIAPLLYERVLQAAGE